MTATRTTVHPPRGLSRLLWRLPIWLYRAHLGWLITDHFLMLEHIGRHSGQSRQAVIEIVKYDKGSDVYYVASGFGRTSDWYQNLLKTPQARIQSGVRKATVTAEVLSCEDGQRILADYAHRHPAAIRALAKLIGYKIETQEIDYAEFAQVVPIVALKVNPPGIA